MDSQQPDDGPVHWQDDLDYSWNDSNWLNPSDDEEGGDGDVAADEEVGRDEFILLPQAGPGPQTQEQRSQRTRKMQSRVLDDEDDTRVVLEHPTAGTILSRVREMMATSHWEMLVQVAAEVSIRLSTLS
jgi:hypothetical protein